MLIVLIVAAVVLFGLIVAVITVLFQGGRDELPERSVAPAAGPDARNRAKGAKAEDDVQRLQLDRLPAATHRSYRNLRIPRVDGKRDTEIDHVVVSAFGVFAVETKSWSGLIAGDAEDDQWVQRIRGRVHRHPNPLKQNRLHTRSLAKFLDLAQRSVHSIVCFEGPETRFERPMPLNVVRSVDLAPYILAFRTEILSAGSVEQINRALDQRTAPADP
ncbi:MAG: nuclease-related domain-containing protein [Acidimicrobiales bacterium]